MKKNILLSIFLLTVLVVHGQEVKIVVGSDITETEIIAHSSQQIMTNAGNFNLSQVDKIVFKDYDPKMLGFYNDLLRKTKLEFEDGASLALEEVDEVMEELNWQMVKGSGDYLNEAGNAGIVGLVLPVVAVGAMILLDEPLVGAIGGVVGIVFQISAWVKVKQAGKMMKNEKKEMLESFQLKK